MVNSYVLTVRLLRRKAKFCKNSPDPGKWTPSSRVSVTDKPRGNQSDCGKCSGKLISQYFEGQHQVIIASVTIICYIYICIIKVESDYYTIGNLPRLEQQYFQL